MTMGLLLHGEQDVPAFRWGKTMSSKRRPLWRELPMNAVLNAMVLGTATKVLTFTLARPTIERLTGW